MIGHLDHKHEMLLQSLLEGKLPRNLAWSEVTELIGRLGEVRPRSGNEVEFVVGSNSAFFVRPNTHSLEVDEVSRLRRFLRDAGVGDNAAAPAAATMVPAGRTVVVIDHHDARIYENAGSSNPEREKTDRPYDPHGFRRHLIHRKEAHYEGQRTPEEDSYYEEIAQQLKPAKEIILIGHGTGKSSAMDFLLEYLKSHHPTISKQVIATEVKDIAALTDPEIEAIARQDF
jgi:hypothetical protein